MELYKAKFTANISIVKADCSNQSDLNCGKDTIQSQDINGVAEFLWETDHWSKAGLVMN